MLKIKIASILVIGSLLLGGCASKSPVNINDKNNNVVSQETKTQENSTNDNKVAETQTVASNTTTQAPTQVATQASNTTQPSTQVSANSNASSNKNTTQATPQPKATAQSSNNVQASTYSKPNTVPAAPAPNPAPVVQQGGVEYLSAVEDEVLRLCNIERSKVGLGALVMDSKVREAGRFKAQEMLTKNYFDHNSPYSGSPFDLMKSRGISFGYAGENIQMSEGKDKSVVTAQYLVTNWMNSPGHRANILKPEFKKMGIGVAFSSNGNKAYESQLFTD